MPLPTKGAAEQTEGAAPQRPHRRRPPDPQEQARRKQWGATWGKVGADYKQQRLAKEA